MKALEASKTSYSISKPIADFIYPHFYVNGEFPTSYDSKEKDELVINDLASRSKKPKLFANKCFHILLKKEYPMEMEFKDSIRLTKDFVDYLLGRV